MSNMQDFYTRLFPEGEVCDSQVKELPNPHMKKLSQLTEATLTQMKALEITLGWNGWYVELLEPTLS